MTQKRYKLTVCLIGFLIATNTIGMLSSLLLFVVRGGLDNIFWIVVGIGMFMFNIYWYKSVRKEYLQK